MAGASVGYAQLPIMTRDMKFQEATGTTVSIVASSGTDAYTLTLPKTTGVSQDLLTSDGGGRLYWTSPNNAMWTLVGNSGTSSLTNFLGTTDAQPLAIRTNNNEVVRITSDGLVLIGSSIGSNTLDVTGTFSATGNSSIGGTLGVTGLITGGNGLTLTGPTLINATGSATTTIGTTEATSALTILTGATGGLTLRGISSGTAADEVLMLNASNRVTKITGANLIAGYAWALLGNEITEGLNFIGTTTPKRLEFRVNNAEVMRVDGATGNVRIGTAPLLPNDTTRVRLQVEGGFATVLDLTRDLIVTERTDTTIAVGNRSMLYILSDNIPTQRRVRLSNGLTSGQRLTLVVRGGNSGGGSLPGASTYGIRLLSADSNLTISGDANLEDGDTMELIFILDQWYELRRSINDP
ncbi:MAG: hypothetical protein FGM33_08665 [Candidatus Kapabacteria bacterium]|nr:hypothetical protein [Candidatus Kapabacteria bacterium]